MASNNQLMEVLRKRYKRMEEYHRGTGMKITYPQFLLLVILFAVAIAFVLFRVLSLGPLVSIIAFIAISTLVVGVPVSMRDARIAAVEDNLPDVLRHMAAVLRAGGTTESALEEISKTDYGPMSEDLSSALKQLREGRTFEEVLMDTSRASGSTLFVRIVRIIVDAKRAGAGMADIMGSIAEDVRDLLRIRRERISRTTMHVLFLYSAALLLGPFIFGFTISVVTYMAEGAATMLSVVSPEEAAVFARTAPNIEALNNLLTIFIACQVIITTLVIGIIQEGKLLKYILRVPIFVLVALLALEFGKFFSRMIIGSGFA